MIEDYECYQIDLEKLKLMEKSALLNLISTLYGATADLKEACYEDVYSEAVRQVRIVWQEVITCDY